MIKNNSPWPGLRFRTMYWLVLLVSALAMASNPTPSLYRNQLSVGEMHSLALSTQGNVWAWGDNAFGQLGDGTNQNRSTAISVKGLNKINIIAIAAGAYHSLALSDAHQVYSWGSNSSGELANGSFASNSTPQQVPSLTGISQIVAGVHFSLALDSNGNVWAWGDNGHGQLGIGSTNDQTAPTRISNLSKITFIAAAGYHAMALDGSNNLYVWGDDTVGELGDGQQQSMVSAPKPIVVKDSSGNTLQCATVAAGFWQSFCVTTTQLLYAWGRNDVSQLGLPTTTAVWTTPQLVAITSSTVQSGAAQCVQNIFAGDNQTFAQTTPPLVTSAPASGATAAPATCALAANTSNDSIWYWGEDNSGQLGYSSSTTATITSPTLATPGTGTTPTTTVANMVFITGGAYHSLGVDQNGLVYAWGGTLSPDSTSILGLGNTASSYSVPNAVQSVDGNGQMNLTKGTSPGSVTSPNQFSFAPQSNVQLLTVVTSQEIVISGLSDGIKVGIQVQDLAADGTPGSGKSQYSLNGGAYTAASGATGMVGNGDRIVVQHVSSAAYLTQHSTKLTVGNISANFTSTTIANPADTTSSGSGKGGCTLNPKQTDGSLLLLLMVIAIVRCRSYFARPSVRD